MIAFLFSVFAFGLFVFVSLLCFVFVASTFNSALENADQRCRDKSKQDAADAVSRALEKARQTVKENNQ